MWSIAGIIAAACAVYWLDERKLRGRKHTKDRWIFIILLLFAAGLGIAQSADLELPSPVEPLTVLLGPVSNFIESLSKLP